MFRILCAILGVALLLVAFSVAKADPLAPTFTAPASGDCLGADTPYTIKWTNSDPTLDHVALAFRSDGQTVSNSATNPSAYFVTDAANTGSYKWTAPPTGTTTGKLTIDAHSADHTLSALATSDLFTIDASGPDQPVITLKQKDTSSATFTWNTVADTGCATLTGYKIYKNDVLIDTVDKSITSYTVNQLTAGSTYKFRVDAYDAVTSIASAPLSVTLGPSTLVSPSPSPLASPSPSTSATFTKIMVQNVSDTDATITFSSTQNVDTTVEYGPSTRYGKTQSATATKDKNGWSYSAHLTDLDDDTIYYFRLDTDNSKTTDASFKTKPVAGSAPLVITTMSVGDQTINPDISTPALVVETEKITVHGTVTPNTKVVVVLHSTVQTFQTTSDSSGNWTMTIDTKGLESGNHDVSVATTNSKGKVGTPKSVLKFQLIPEAHAAPLTFTVPNANSASQFGKVYGDVFLVITVVGTLWFIVRAHRLNRHTKNSRQPRFISVQYHSQG